MIKAGMVVRVIEPTVNMKRDCKAGDLIRVREILYDGSMIFETLQGKKFEGSPGIDGDGYGTASKVKRVEQL